MIPFAIAGLQAYTSALHDNLPRLRSRIDVMMELYPWVQMVVLSELATFGPLLQFAQPLPSPAEEAYREIARRHRIWLLPGTHFEKSEGRIYNTASVINPEGDVVGRYRKMFPFYPYEVGVEPGDEFLVWDVPDVGRFGISICYDMWFPETARCLVARGAEVILHPTMTTTIDREVELSIVRSTAAVNQCFVVDVNGMGDGGNGRSLIVGPAGDVLYQAGTSEEMIPLEIDFERVRRSREVGLRGLGQPLKSFRDRKVRFPVYGEGSPEFDYLKTLGPLEKPARGSRVGLRPLPTDKGHPEDAVTGSGKGMPPVPAFPAPEVVFGAALPEAPPPAPGTKGVSS